MRRQLAAGVLLLALTGCGGGDGDGPPKDVAGHLTSVDAALKAHRYDDARAAIQRLVSATQQAQEKGTYDEEQAQRVLAAAAVLTNALPTPAAAPTAAPQPTAQPKQGAPAPAPEPKKRRGKKGHDGD